MLRMLNARMGIPEREQREEGKTPSYNLFAYAFNNYNIWALVHFAQTLDRPRRVGIANAFRTAILNLKRSGSEPVVSPPTLIPTNGFVIRDSAKESNSDGHLQAPSNGSLTAIGSCSILRGAA